MGWGGIRGAKGIGATAAVGDKATADSSSSEACSWRPLAPYFRRPCPPPGQTTSPPLPPLSSPSPVARPLQPVVEALVAHVLRHPVGHLGVWGGWGREERGVGGERGAVTHQPDTGGEAPVRVRVCDVATSPASRHTNTPEQHELQIQVPRLRGHSGLRVPAGPQLPNHTPRPGTSQPPPTLLLASRRSLSGSTLTNQAGQASWMRGVSERQQKG